MARTRLKIRYHVRSMARPERLLVYDRTCTGSRLLPGLSHSWVAGFWLYRGLGRLDARIGVRSWDEALCWLAQRPGPIGEVQYWGHGKWGELFVDQESLSSKDLAANSPHAANLSEIAAKMTPRSLWWFRTCETFGAQRGQHFAAAFAERMRCRVAGHTYIIGPWQSGLHSLEPGANPHWSAQEGLAEGSPGEPVRALNSSRSAPHTIHCLQGHIPAGY